MEPRKLLRTVLLAVSLSFVLVTWTNVGLGQNNVTPDSSVFAMLPDRSQVDTTGPWERV